jgi:hypothetical protein
MARHFNICHIRKDWPEKLSGFRNIFTNALHKESDSQTTVLQCCHVATESNLKAKADWPAEGLSASQGLNSIQ